MSGPPKRCPLVARTFTPVLPVSSGGPLEKIGLRPKLPEMKTTTKPTRANYRVSSVIVRTNAKLPRRPRADAERNFSSSETSTFVAAGC